MLTHNDALPARSRLPAIAVLCAAVISLLAGCATRQPEPGPGQPAPAPVATASTGGTTIPAGAKVFDIDPRRSIVTIRVYRSGPMAKLGHNHVITSAEESGFAWRGPTPADSGFELRIPVSTLVVDDPAARAAAGPDFDGAVPDSARDGTKKNLLRAEVLDAAQFPDVTVRAGGLGGTWQDPVALADVTLKGVTRRVELPLDLADSAGTLTARGTFRIRQTEFGMVPFSVGGGAIQVADEIALGFEIVATAR
jgi:polyisoprenoid-binding protein YceI